jgi:hypothetical protein
MQKSPWSPKEIFSHFCKNLNFNQKPQFSTHNYRIISKTLTLIIQHHPEQEKRCLKSGDQKVSFHASIADRKKLKLNCANYSGFFATYALLYIMGGANHKRTVL